MALLRATLVPFAFKELPPIPLKTLSNESWLSRVELEYKVLPCSDAKPEVGALSNSTVKSLFGSS